MLILQPLRRYARFRGRATRAEFWLWQLLLLFLFGALNLWLFATMNTRFTSDVSGDLSAWYGQFLTSTPASAMPLQLMGFASLFLLLPSLAVAVRRLHDSDMSGWWLLISFTGIGNLVLLILFLTDGTRGANRFGADPKGRRGF